MSWGMTHDERVHGAAVTEAIVRSAASGRSEPVDAGSG